MPPHLRVGAVTGPRDARGMTGPGEWVEAVQSGRLKPQTVAHALAVAFTEALLSVMDDPEQRTLAAGEASGGERRAALTRWAQELGMGRETLRMTLVGQRWAGLDELHRASLHPVLGPALEQCLADALPLALKVLHKALDSGPGHGSDGLRGESWVSPGERGTVRKRKPMPEPLEQLEARIRADLRTLDQRIVAEQRAGRPVDTKVDWAEVRRLMGAPRAIAPQAHPGMAARVRAAGVPSLADLVRNVLRGKGAMRSYAIKAGVQQQVAVIQGDGGGVDITGSQVDAVLGRLKRRGEVESLGYGLFRATSTMRGVTPKP